MKVTLLIAWLLYPTAPSSAEPSEATLANRVETQAEVAVGHTSFTPPPMSRFSILVSEMATGEGIPTALLEGSGETGGRSLAFVGNKANAVAAAKALTDANGALSALAALQSSPQIAELASNASDSVQLMTLALEKSDAGGNPFLTLTVKGTVQAWNKLVNAVADRMEQLYKEPAPDVKEWGSMKNFLMDPSTHDFRGILAGFAEKTSP